MSNAIRAMEQLKVSNAHARDATERAQLRAKAKLTSVARTVLGDAHVQSNLRMAAPRSKGATAYPDNSGSNLELILTHGTELGGRLRFNSLSKRVEVTGGRFANLAASDLQTAVKNWLETNWMITKPAKTEVGDQLLYVARRNVYSPVAEYLESLPWDGVPRIGGYSSLGDGVTVLSSWLSRYCGSPEDEHTSRVAGMFMIGAVARALNPGCKHDCVLTLIGRQGVKKSTVLRTLAGEWFSDTPIKLGDKDGYMVAASTWIVELAELSSLRDAESAYERHKAFLSSASDLYRPPYAPALESFPRACIFAGTTNDEEYLSDPTGNRRHWSALVTDVDLAALRRDRDQLWAEAVHRYKAGLAHSDLDRPAHLRWWLTHEEQVAADRANQDHVEEDLYATTIAEWAGKQSAEHKRRGWTGAQIAERALGLSVVDLARKAIEMRVAAACRAGGLVKDRHPQTTSDGRQRRWRLPAQPS